MATVKHNRRLAQSRPEGGFALRVFHQKARGKRMPRYLIKCGCCGEKVEIYFGDGFLEIDGVMAPVENWRELLLPLLQPGRGSGSKRGAARSKVAKKRRA